MELGKDYVVIGSTHDVVAKWGHVRLHIHVRNWLENVLEWGAIGGLHHSLADLGVRSQVDSGYLGPIKGKR